MSDYVKFSPDEAIKIRAFLSSNRVFTFDYLANIVGVGVLPCLMMLVGRGSQAPSPDEQKKLFASLTETMPITTPWDTQQDASAATVLNRIAWYWFNDTEQKEAIALLAQYDVRSKKQVLSLSVAACEEVLIEVRSKLDRNTHTTGDIILLFNNFANTLPADFQGKDVFSPDIVMGIRLDRQARYFNKLLQLERNARHITERVLVEANKELRHQNIAHKVRFLLSEPTHYHLLDRAFLDELERQANGLLQSLEFQHPDDRLHQRIIDEANDYRSDGDKARELGSDPDALYASGQDANND